MLRRGTKRMRVSHKRLVPAPRIASVRALSDNSLFGDIVEQRARAAKRELAILAEAFHKYATDCDGMLDREEMLHALENLQLPVGEVEVDTLFKNLTGKSSDTAGSVKL